MHSREYNRMLLYNSDGCIFFVLLQIDCTSARPTSEDTASVWIGCTAKSKEVANTIRLRLVLSLSPLQFIDITGSEGFTDTLLLTSSSHA